jgi:hypothetical protein
MERAADFGETFGCGYCRDPANRRRGAITEVTRDGSTAMVLLRCPQCGSYYAVSADRTTTRRITDSEAAAEFGIVD